MEWSAAVDGYCERLDASFWSEPLNAASNVAFFAAAMVAGRFAARRGGLDVAVGALLLLLVAIGVGSFLFHTVATRWAGLADVVPIQLFILAYVFLAMRRFAGLSGWFALSVTANFVAFSVLSVPAVEQIAGAGLNGSEGYLPPLLALLCVGIALAANGRAGPGRALLAGAALFAVSLTLRTTDAAACPSFPAGTHFAWHLMNAVLLGWLVVAMVRYGRPP